jgi:hypothetical protein
MFIGLPPARIKGWHARRSRSYTGDEQYPDEDPSVVRLKRRVGAVGTMNGS